MKLIRYQIAVHTRSGKVYTSQPQVTPYQDVSEDEARAIICDRLQTSWQPAGLFQLGAIVEGFGDRYINAAHIETIGVIWLDPEDAAPPAGEVAGGAGIAADYADSAE